MQFKKGDRVEFRDRTIENQGRMVRNCEDYEGTALIQFNGTERHVWVPVENLELAPSSSKVTRYVWHNNTFEGVYPTCTAALIVAESKERATELLNAELESNGLEGDVNPRDVWLTTTDKEQVILLSDGEY